VNGTAGIPAFSAVGDVKVHMPQIPCQYDRPQALYFDINFEYVKKYILQADLALCNLETSFAENPYGLPYQSPESLAGA
jgi:poly-gamma-glutamate synthesis protein (capsule biosynthesis protein)